MRTNYEMTAADLQTLLDAMKPVPMIALQCGTPPSVQENANAAWARLGKKMGFDPMTVQPTGRGDRFFSAVETAKPEKPHIIKDGKAQGPGGRAVGSGALAGRRCRMICFDDFDLGRE